MTGRVVFQRVSVRALRNLSRVDFEPAPGLNVITGDNGHGKTSLLEGLYLVATTRSFRTEQPRELIQQGQQLATVQTSICDSGHHREQRVALGHYARRLLVDGKPPRRVTSYATRTPVVVFHPGDLQLVAGPAATRRRLLTRVALFLDPSSGEHRRRYVQALRERQRSLEERGPNAPELDAYEQLIAEHGSALAASQGGTAALLTAALERSFACVAAAATRLQARHLPGGCEDRREYAAQLRTHRAEDLRRRRTGFGPHRDDLQLLLEGQPARRHASQGQQRILTLALKLAELECVTQARAVHPILLLDDVSSELDPARTGAVYAFLRATESQVFVTATRPELLTARELGSLRRTDWSLVNGALNPA